MRGDGFLGDYGPLSFRHIMLAITIVAGIMVFASVWAMTPWSPW